MRNTFKFEIHLTVEAVHVGLTLQTYPPIHGSVYEIADYQQTEISLIRTPLMLTSSRRHQFAAAIRGSISRRH